MNGKIGLRIVSALVLIAAIAGIGYFAFRAGVAQGSPITLEAPTGDANVAPMPYPHYGYGMPFHRPFGFGFGSSSSSSCSHSCSAGTSSSPFATKN